MSNVIAGRITTPAHAGGGPWVAAFRFGEEFFGVGFVVLSLAYANFASPVAGPASIEIECADIVFLRAGGDVWAGHATEYPPAYEPTGVFWKPDLLFPLTLHWYLKFVTRRFSPLHTQILSLVTVPEIGPLIV